MWWARDWKNNKIKIDLPIWPIDYSITCVWDGDEKKCNLENFTSWYDLSTLKIKVNQINQGHHITQRRGSS